MRKAIRIFLLCVVGICSFSVVSASAFRIGDQGSEVAEIQGQLASLGYDVAADGDFGPATAEAVKEFQAANGLEADGLVGASTYSALLGGSCRRSAADRITFPAVLSRHRCSTSVFPMFSEALRPAALTAPGMCAMYSPMRASICRAWRMSSMRSAIRSPRRSSFPAISCSSPRMNTAPPMWGFIWERGASSMQAPAVAWPLIRSIARIGAPVISVPAGSCDTTKGTAAAVPFPIR